MEWTPTERQHLAAALNHIDRAKESLKTRGKWRRRDQLSYVQQAVQPRRDPTAGRVIRTHPIRHDSDKAHGVFPNPNEKANRINAAS